jgi:hypothetical protein
MYVCMYATKYIMYGRLQSVFIWYVHECNYVYMNYSTTNIDLRDEDEIKDKRKKKSKNANAKSGKSPNNIVLKDDESEVKQYIILQSVDTSYIHTYIHTYTYIKYKHVH